MVSALDLVYELLRKVRWLLVALSVTLIGFIILFRFQAFPEPWSSLIRELGVAFIIAGTVSLIYELFLRITLAQTILELIEFPRSLNLAGIKNVNKRDNATESLKFLQTIYPRKVRLLGTTTDYYFRGGRGSQLYDEMERLLERRCEMQLLMLHPDFAQFRQKEEEETGAHSIETLEEKLMRIFNERFALSKKYPNLKIRLYKSVPLCAMTILDDRVLKVTPYLYQVLGLKSPTFEIWNNEMEGCIFDSYEQHFDKLWNSAEERSEPFDRRQVRGEGIIEPEGQKR